MTLTRRSFITRASAALVTTLAAPAVIRTAGLLMPIRKRIGNIPIQPRPDRLYA